MSLFERMVLRALCLILAGISRQRGVTTPGWAEEVRKFYDDVRKLLEEGRL